MDINAKEDWSEEYIQPTPASYLQIVSQGEYNVPDYALKFLRPLLKTLHTDFQRPVNVFDIGASYGIISSLLLHDLTMEQLIDFFLDNGLPKERTWKEIEGFYLNQDIRHTEYKFYLSDISLAAMNFSERVQVCEKAFHFDLKYEKLPIDLKEKITTIDLYIATGSLGYIGNNLFQQIFPIISNNSLSPLFAFVVYRAFYSYDIERVFKKYNYTLIKSSRPFKRARRFASVSEQEKAIESLHERNIDTTDFEDKGYYACEFYLGVPISQEEKLHRWLIELEESF